MEKNKEDNKLLKIISLIVIIIYCSYYYFTRSYISNIKDCLIDELKLTATDYSRISAAFSTGYSVSQVGGGYLLDRISVRYLLPGFLTIASIASYVFLYSTNISIIEISRYVLGAFFCLGSIGGLKYVTLVWKSQFAFYCNLINFSMCVFAAFAASGSLKVFMISFGWRKFFTIVTSCGLILAAVLFYVLRIAQDEEKKIKLIEVESKKETGNSFKESLLNVLQLPGFLWTALYVISIGASSFLLMDGYGNTMVKAKFPNLTLAQISEPSFYNMVGSSIGSLTIILLVVLKLKTKSQMFLFSCLSMIATAILLFANPCFNTMLVCFGILGFCGMGQGVGFAWLQKNLDSKYHGLGFGLLNFLGMFFGCAVVQRMSGIVLDYVKRKTIAGGVPFYEGYSYDNILTMFKVMFFLNVLSLVSTFILKEEIKKPNKNS